MVIACSFCFVCCLIFIWFNVVNIALDFYELFSDAVSVFVVGKSEGEAGVLLADTLEKANVSLDDIDVIVPHQASKALDMIIPHLGLQDKNYINCVKEYGNMVSASIPFTLCKAIHNQQVKPGNQVMLFGTVAGLTSNILIFKY